MELSFDIGANAGNKFEKILNKTKKLVAFEPNPNLYENLKRRYKDIENVTIDNRALSDQIGEKEFNLCHADTISTFSQDWITNSRFSNNYSWNQKIIVTTTTLDSIIEEYGEPNYVKVDVEGYELEVFLGLTKLIPNCIFSFEWAEEQKSKIILTLSHLKNLGYTKFYYTEGDDCKFEDEISWVEFDKFEFIEKLEPQRKTLWGMVYFKK